MPDLTFQIEHAGAVPFAAAPLVAFQVRVTNAGPEHISAAVLRCQIQIEAARRRYTAGEQAGLGDLFGEPHRWGQTVRTMLWTHASAVVPEFTGSTLVDLQVPCTFDFNIAVVKYFQGLREGEIPLCFQFSGSVFYHAEDGNMQVAPIPWDREARFRLALQTWTQMMDVYYPNSAWLCLRRDVFERLCRYKTEHAIPTWEQTVDGLLERVEEEVSR